MPILNKRLIKAAEMLGDVKSVADIGTDHAFLPIYLIREGICERVIACDIAEGPLSVAATNITKYGLLGKIELRLADGLKGLKPMEVRGITILGMGGETEQFRLALTVASRNVLGRCLDLLGMKRTEEI